MGEMGLILSKIAIVLAKSGKVVNDVVNVLVKLLLVLKELSAVIIYACSPC